MFEVNQLKWFICSFIFCLVFDVANAQKCPPIIVFENGSFNGWNTYTGYTSAVGNNNIISLATSPGPINDRHTLFTRGSREVDPYGGFPVICPNGSGYSIKLGNDVGGGQAEGGHGHAALGVFGLRIVTEVADQDDLVDAACHGIPYKLPGVRPG